MRTLNEHQVNPANDTLKITVTDEPGAGGANHRYEVSGIPNQTCAGVAIGFVLFVVLPWLWQFMKPWIHTLTA